MSLCWLKEKISPQECIEIDPDKEKELLSNKGLRLKYKCINCPKFFMDISHVYLEPKLELFKSIPQLVMGEIEEEKAEGRFEKAKNRIKSFLLALASIQGTIEVEKIIHTALVTLTHREGFGFNRAIFFSAEDDILKPAYALGPKNSIEGSEIWDFIENSGISMESLIKDAQITKKDTEKLADIFSLLEIPISEEHPVGKAFLEKTPTVFYYHHGKDYEIYKIMASLGVTSFGILPIWGDRKPSGMFMVDNVVSMKPVDEKRLKVAADFANIFSLALEKAKLYHELREKLKELEEAKSEIEKQQKIILNMEKALSLKEISSKIIHEIRNPLTVIGGLTNRMIKKKAYDEKSLEIISKEVKRIYDILSDIDTYNKSIKPQKVETDVKYVIKETIRNLRKKIPELKTELVFPKGELTAFVDPRHLSKLIENAVINAHEAHTKSKSKEVIKIKVGKEKDNLLIKIKDKGGGIPEEIRNRIFEPFFTTKEDGTGMGIPVMAVITREHGGDIEIRNINGGTEVKIVLPINRREE